MDIENHAHLEYYTCLCGKFMDVYSAVMSQADIVPLIQNFSNWNTGNCEINNLRVLTKTCVAHELAVPLELAVNQVRVYDLEFMWRSLPHDLQGAG